MTNENIFTVGGTVQASNGLYIPRSADDELLALCRAGSFAYVLTPRQLGKSSLMVRTAQQLTQEGFRSVTIDLSQIGVQVTAEQWYLGLLAMIEDQLTLETNVVKWWQERKHLGITQRLTLFFQEVLLREVRAPVVIFVDEIDTTLSLNFTDDFFAAIRYFYNARALHKDFQRLSLVLIGVATPGDLIRDPARTPFNVGRRVDLTDFTSDEAWPLAAGLGLPDGEARQVLSWVMNWTSGHPYLTQSLCRTIASQNRSQWSSQDVDRVVVNTFFGEKSRQDHNLQFVADMLTERANSLKLVEPADVLVTYRSVLRNRPPVRDEEQSIIKSHLKLAGVVCRENDLLSVRNRIYREVFDERWIKNALPPTWTKRQLTRARRVQVGLALLLLLVLVLAGATTYAAVYARKQRVVAEASRQEAVDTSHRLIATLNELEKAKTEADIGRNEAERQRHEAFQQRAIAEKAAAALRTANLVAETRSREAIAEKNRAEATSKNLAATLMELTKTRDEAIYQRQIAEARANSERSFREGVYLFQNRNQSEAIAKFSAAVPYYEQIGDKLSKAFTLSMIASAYSNSYDRSNAVKFYAQALQVYKEMPDPSGEAAMEIALGDNWSPDVTIDGKAVAQMDLYEAGLKAYRQSKDPVGEANTLLKIGDKYREKKDSLKAVDFYQQALAIYRKTEQVTPGASEAATLMRLASITTENGDKKTARDYYEQVLTLVQKSGDISAQANVIARIGETFGDSPEEQRALEDRFTTYVEGYQRAGNLRGQSLALRWIGDFYKSVNKKEMALAYYERAYELNQSTDDNYISGELLVSIGGLFNEPGEEQKAPDYYQGLLKKYQASRNILAEALVLRVMGDYYKSINDFPKALDYYNQALQKSQFLGGFDSIAALLNMGSISYDETLRKRLISGLVTKLNTGDYREKAKAAEIVGSLYRAFINYKQAIVYYDLALSHYRRAGDREGEASALLLLANTSSAANERQKAREFYYEAIRVYGESGALFYQAKVYSVLGVFSYDNIQESRESYKKALAILKGIKDSPGVASAITDTLKALMFVSENEVQRDQVIQEALEMSRKNNDPSEEARVLIAAGYYNTSYTTQALAIYRRLNNRYGEANTLGILAGTYAKTDKSKAIDYLHQALAVFESLSARSEQITVLKQLSSLYEEMGNKEEAQKTAKQASALEALKSTYYPFAMPPPPVN